MLDGGATNEELMAKNGWSCPKMPQRYYSENKAAMNNCAKYLTGSSNRSGNVYVKPEVSKKMCSSPYPVICMNYVRRLTLIHLVQPLQVQKDFNDNADELEMSRMADEAEDLEKMEKHLFTAGEDLFPNVQYFTSILQRKGTHTSSLYS